MTSFLIFDTSCLAHAARWTTGGLKHEDIPTGVSFGVIRSIEKHIEIHNPDICIFAFDYGGPGLRGQIYPGYKISRNNEKQPDGTWVPKEKTDEEVEADRAFIDQCRDLYRNLLPSMGFRNLFRVKGYEGDDIVAKIAADIKERDSAVIISGDQDMWQCLRSNVIWSSPAGKVVTIQSFKEEWGLYPFQWATVKAIAGCSSDDVIGVKGVGEKTAAKWVRGLLNPKSTKAKAIEDNLHLIKINTPLVTIPYPGLEEFTILPDECTHEKKRKVYDQLGIREDRKKVVRKPTGGFDL